MSIWIAQNYALLGAAVLTVMMVGSVSIAMVLTRRFLPHYPPEGVK